jgi:L-ascorbate metabolism protein UlaG (beta-lactamase superfamily)
MRTDIQRGYNGYALSVGRRHILFGGDTANTHLFEQVKGARPYDLAIMPVGAYNPWIRYHCTPEQAWRMAQDARCEFFLPVHHRTFQLSHEPYDEPIERVLEAAGRHTDRVAARAIGHEWHIA